MSNLPNIFAQIAAAKPSPFSAARRQLEVDFSSRFKDAGTLLTIKVIDADKRFTACLQDERFSCDPVRLHTDGTVRPSEYNREFSAVTDGTFIVKESWSFSLVRSKGDRLGHYAPFRREQVIVYLRPTCDFARLREILEKMAK